MTTPRKTTASKTKSGKKVSSSPTKKPKKRSKPKLLPAGEYTCTVDSLVGNKLTLNVNDLTLKDTAKLGFRLKIRDEPQIPAEGDYDGYIVGFNEPAPSKTREGMYTMGMRVKTDWGIMVTYFLGTLQTVMFMRRKEHLYIGEYVKLRVKHMEFNDRNTFTTSIKF